MGVINSAGYIAEPISIGENFYSVFTSGKLDKQSVIDIIYGLGWGLGYFGMPHILIRYMSIKSKREMNKSRIIGCSWTTLILIMSSIVGIVGRQFLGDALVENGNSLVFVYMVRKIFPALIAGFLLSAILAASMSTADSQLLASASAFASDVYKPVFRKKASDKEMLWAGRIIVFIITILAFIIAINPNSGGIMGLVECAWGAFGSAFGPVIILSLFWKRFNYQGAVSGIVAGFTVDALWYWLLSSGWLIANCGIAEGSAAYTLLSDLGGIYEIVPGFLVGLLVAYFVARATPAPSKEVEELFDYAVEETKNGN